MKEKSIKEQLKEFFIEDSNYRENEKNSFLFTRTLVNKKTNEKIYLNNFSIQNKFKKDYYFYKMYCRYLYDIASKEYLEPYFLTLTQLFSLENKNIYESISYLENYIRIYRKALREVIREFQRNNIVLFISIIEFNNNLFFHMHAIIFIYPEFKDRFLKLLDNKIELFELGNQKKFQKIPNKKEYKKTCNYLLKSIKKASEDIEYAYLLDGTINVLKYKLITHSKTKINKKMYFKLYPYVRKKFNNSKNKFINIYKYMTKRTKIETLNKIPSKKQIKKKLNNLKKHTHKIYIFQEKKEIQKLDEFVELQNQLLLEKISNLFHIKDSNKLLQTIENYITNYINSLKEIFSYNKLMNFKWKFNTLYRYIKYISY